MGNRRTNAAGIIYSVINLAGLRLSSVGMAVGYYEGKATFASPDRINPPYGVFSVCGGCRLQHLKYDQTLVWKKQWVIDVSFAANEGWPILLTTQTSLPLEMKAFLQEKQPTKVYITGGQLYYASCSYNIPIIRSSLKL